MRVLHLAESPYFGGINAHIRNVFEAFHESGAVSVRVASLPGVREDRWLLDALGDSNVYEVPMRSRFDRGAAVRLREYVASEKIDLVHTHNYRATLLATHAGLSVPIINTCHGMVAEPSLKLRLYQALELRAMRRCAATIAVSRYVRDWLLKKGLGEGKVRVIYNGYEPPETIGDLRRSSLGIADDTLVYLFIGRLAHGKGIREFLEALRGMQDAVALIAGDGPLRADAEAVAHAGRVHAVFTGAQREVRGYYEIADAVVLPSRMEALPMVLIEAAAYGKPVVATNAGGISEIVLDGVTGMLVPVRNADALREALIRMRNEELRARMGAAAHARWKELFTRAQMAKELESVYQTVLGR
ncbi:MAG: glycosyltransferase family 4 protein [Candidatus Hydrogenedentes bacterium]|nr:glycosyltransferase family 4 protein [Candidatus Hydrogenedentota bacterium]